MIPVPDNMQQGANNQAMAGMQASFGSTGDKASQAIMQMNTHLNDMKPYIEAKNTIHDALYKTGEISQERLAGLDPKLRNAIINRDNAFLQNNYAQIENVIQGNNLAFNNAVGIITGGLDRLERQKEKEFNQARQILEQQVSLLGSGAFEGMSPEQIEMIESRLGISVKDMEAGIRAKEQEQQAERQWEKDMKEQEFAHRQNVDNQQLAISRGNLAVSQGNLALSRANAARSNQPQQGTWGKVIYNDPEDGSGGRTTAVYQDPNGKRVPMSTWISANYDSGRQPQAILNELNSLGYKQEANTFGAAIDISRKTGNAAFVNNFLKNNPTMKQLGF